MVDLLSGVECLRSLVTSQETHCFATALNSCACFCSFLFSPQCASSSDRSTGQDEMSMAAAYTLMGISKLVQHTCPPVLISLDSAVQSIDSLDDFDEFDSAIAANKEHIMLFE